MDNNIIKTMRTAVLTSYPKIFTDIPYASQIFFSSLQLAVKYGFSFQPALFVAEMAVEIEARHKAINAVLREIQTDNTLVIELGVGLSPRRCEFSHLEYIEVDYSTIVNMKKEIYMSIDLPKYNAGLIASDLSEHDKWGYLLRQQIKSKHYNQVIVVSEGLFWYLKKDHIQGIISELKKLLNGIHWMWVTADCPVNEQQNVSYKNVIADSSNKSPVEPFADYNAFHDFFTCNKFSIKRYAMVNLVSPSRIYSGQFFSISLDEVKKRMDTYTDIAILKVGI